MPPRNGMLIMGSCIRLVGSVDAVSEDVCGASISSTTGLAGGCAGGQPIVPAAGGGVCMGGGPAGPAAEDHGIVIGFQDQGSSPRSQRCGVSGGSTARVPGASGGRLWPCAAISSREMARFGSLVCSMKGRASFASSSTRRAGSTVPSGFCTFSSDTSTDSTTSRRLATWPLRLATVLVSSSPEGCCYVYTHKVVTTISIIIDLYMYATDKWLVLFTGLRSEGVRWKKAETGEPDRTEPGGAVGTPNLPRNRSLVRFVDSKLPGGPLIDMIIPPLKVQILLESSPPKSRVLARRLAAKRRAWRQARLRLASKLYIYIYIYIYIHNKYSITLSNSIISISHYKIQCYTMKWYNPEVSIREAGRGGEKRISGRARPEFGRRDGSSETTYYITLYCIVLYIYIYRILYTLHIYIYI